MSENINKKTQTKDPKEALLSKLLEVFPQLVADGQLDISILSKETGLAVSGLVNTASTFGLVWPGKDEAIAALGPSLATLVPDTDNSKNWDKAENVFIEGDNLEVLKIIEQAYDDKVRLIYIDPPYNTGNDFVYSDDFSDEKRHYLEVTGQVDPEGNKLVANLDTSGRKHANWLTMMYSRLSKARNLLTQDGAIFVSIDDNEVHHLRMLMDHIFGPENFIGQFVWAAGRKNNAKFVSVSHEYMLCYSRNVGFLTDSIKEWRVAKEGLDQIYRAAAKCVKEANGDFSIATTLMKSWYRDLSEADPSKRHKHYAFIDERGVYFPDNIAAPGSSGGKYEVLHPSTGKPVKLPTSGWRFTEESMNRLLAEDRIHFGVDETTVPNVKRYLKESEFEVPYSVFYKDGRGATNRLKEFLGGPYFDFPKDETVLQQIVEFATDKDSIVMDFFGGSGTMGHAVALQNEKDGGRRKYVFVTLNEKTAKGSPAEKAGIKTVSDIALMRLRKVAEVFPIARDQGLRVLRLGASAFRPFFPEEGIPFDSGYKTLEKNATDHQIVTQIGLLNGIRLDQPWEWVNISDSQAVLIGKSIIMLAREMNSEILAEILKLDVSNYYFLEDSFAGKDDLKKTAIFQIEQIRRNFEAY